MSGDHANENALDTEMKVHSLGNESFGGANGIVGENLATDEAKTSRELAKWICATDVSLQIIEDPGFLDLVHTLNPFVKLGTVKMLKAEYLKIFKEERVKIKQVLADLDGQISLSVDVLKTPACYEYLCVTAHFIDDGWEVKKWVLSLCHVWEEEDDVSKVLLKCLSDWNIENKISTITMTNGSDSENDATVKILKDLVQEKKKLQLNGQLFHVYCCADILSLIVQDTLAEIQEIIGEVRHLVPCGRPQPHFGI
jgi:hypothetical protein